MKTFEKKLQFRFIIVFGFSFRTDRALVNL